MNKKERVFIEERLEDLKEEERRRDVLGWNDYEWMVREGDFVRGKISILEEIKD